MVVHVGTLQTLPWIDVVKRLRYRRFQPTSEGFRLSLPEAALGNLATNGFLIPTPAEEDNVVNESLVTKSILIRKSVFGWSMWSFHACNIRSTTT